MFRRLSAASLAALLLTVSMAQAAPSTAPADPTRDLPTTERGAPASPGDTFRVAEQGKPGQETPWTVSCRGVVNADGTFTIFLTNESGKTIPSRSRMTIDYPGGDLGTRLDHAWADGAQQKATLEGGHFAAPGTEFSCTVHLTVWKKPDLGN